jgi:quercetin dioxygenase-like cupin family protein
MVKPITVAAHVDDAPKAARIVDLERAMLEMPQVEVPTAHDFAPGLYIRTIEIPAGTVLTGHIHTTEHIFIVSKGDITIATEDGMRRVQAPFQMVCRPGLKRAGYAHTDVVCTNVHITPETDLAKLEALLIERPQLEAPRAQEEIVWHG